MRLEEIEVIPYSLPFREPYITARGGLHERKLILVRVRAEGLDGWGETTSLSLRGGASIEQIAADESLVSPFDARRAKELGACDVASVKVAKVGGLGAALEIAETMPSYLSSSLEGPVGITAAAHAVQALRYRGGDAAVAHGLATERLFSATVGRGATAERDELLLDERPGLGVEIDEDALAARRLD